VYTTKTAISGLSHCAAISPWSPAATTSHPTLRHARRYARYPVATRAILSGRKSLMPRRAAHGPDCSADHVRGVGSHYCLGGGLHVHRQTTLESACHSQSAPCQRRDRPGRIRREETQADRPVRAQLEQVRCLPQTRRGADSANVQWRVRWQSTPKSGSRSSIVPVAGVQRKLTAKCSLGANGLRPRSLVPNPPIPQSP